MACLTPTQIPVNYLSASVGKATSPGWRLFVLGVAAGVGLTLLQQTVGLVRLQTATLMVDIYPVELHAADVLLTAAAYIVVAHVVTRLTVGAMLKDNATI